MRRFSTAALLRLDPEDVQSYFDAAFLHEEQIESAESRETRLMSQNSLERHAQLLRNKLFNNVEVALAACDSSRDSQTGFFSLKPVKLAMQKAQEHPDITSFDILKFIARQMTRNPLKSRDCMVAIWSLAWQNVYDETGLSIIGQPAKLAGILRPVLLNGTENAAASVLKSLDTLHGSIHYSQRIHPNRDIVSADDVHSLVAHYAISSAPQSVVAAVARQACKRMKERSQACNDGPDFQPNSRLQRLIVEAPSRVAVRKRPARAHRSPRS